MHRSSFRHKTYTLQNTFSMVFESIVTACDPVHMFTILSTMSHHPCAGQCMSQLSLVHAACSLCRCRHCNNHKCFSSRLLTWCGPNMAFGIACKKHKLASKTMKACYFLYQKHSSASLVSTQVAYCTCASSQ